MALLFPFSTQGEWNLVHIFRRVFQASGRFAFNWRAFLLLNENVWKVQHNSFGHLYIICLLPFGFYYGKTFLGYHTQEITKSYETSKHTPFNRRDFQNWKGYFC